MSDISTEEILDVIFDLKLALTKHVSRGFHNLGEKNAGHGKKNFIKTIVILYRKGPLTPSELSKYMDLRKSTMTAIIDLLTDKNFVSVRSSKDDRRKKIICLTDKGKMQAEKRKEIILNILSESFKQLNDDEISQFLIHLKGINDVLYKIM